MHTLGLITRRRIRPIDPIDSVEVTNPRVGAAALSGTAGEAGFSAAGFSVAARRATAEGSGRYTCFVIAVIVARHRDALFGRLDDVQLDAIAVRSPHAELAEIGRAHV